MESGDMMIREDKLYSMSFHQDIHESKIRT